MTDSAVRHRTLEIEGPTAECGHCHFRNYLAGRWFIKAGQLTWHGDADPLPRRGPSIGSCGECGQEFEFIALDGSEVAADQVKALQDRGDLMAQAERDVGLGTRRVVWWDGALWWRTYREGGFDGYRTLRRRLACGALAQRMRAGERRD